MAEKKPTAGLIELKRVVMVKAIVTDQFKENLEKELQRAIENIDRQSAMLDTQSKSYLDNLHKQGLVKKATAYQQQISQEKARQAAAKSDLMMKIAEAKKLQIGTEFVQGPLEGPVTVKPGDNLYKKVGGAEIIVKDGIIQEIRGV